MRTEISTGDKPINISCVGLYNSLSHKILIIIQYKTDVIPSIIKYSQGVFNCEQIKFAGHLMEKNNNMLNPKLINVSLLKSLLIKCLVPTKQGLIRDEPL